MAVQDTSAWAEIIAKAAVSDLGIAALAILVVGSVILALIRPSDHPKIRVTVVILLMVFCGGLMGAAIYSAQPVALSAQLAVGATEEGPSQQLLADIPPEASPAPTTAVASTPKPRADCGTAWTGWIDVGGGVGNPCPSNCTRGAELGQSYRVVGFPPRAQTKHKFQCWVRD